MSEWHVIRAPGFYAVDPVGGNRVFGKLFNRAVVDRGVGKQLIIEARENRRTTVHQVCKHIFEAKSFEDGVSS
jgi:putative alpha-1,2-mannosidase